MYKVKEVFYSIQGEGANVGRAAVFVRFSGCNLWSGKEEDRDRGPSCSRWCDTDFLGTNGPNGGTYTAADLAALCAKKVPYPALLVLTGGEPLLQVDTVLLEALHNVGFECAVETNGTLPIPIGLDWVCVSPKARTKLVVLTGDELKLVYPQEGLCPSDFSELAFDHFFLQPLDGPAKEANTRAALNYCLKNPQWRLSLQTHKILGVP